MKVKTFAHIFMSIINNKRTSFFVLLILLWLFFFYLSLLGNKFTEKGFNLSLTPFWNITPTTWIVFFSNLPPKLCYYSFNLLSDIPGVECICPQTPSNWLTENLMKPHQEKSPHASHGQVGLCRKADANGPQNEMRLNRGLHWERIDSSLTILFKQQDKNQISQPGTAKKADPL